MGCAESRVSTGPGNHNPRPRHHRSGTHDDRDGHNGDYIPRRRQGEHGRRRHQGDGEARAQRARDAAERERNRRALLKHYDADEDEKARLRRRYDEHVGRKRAEAYGQEVRNAAEREANRRALGAYGGRDKRGNLGRPRDEEEFRRRAKGEKIRVYAGPDITSRWGV